jgi:hypothetical protein
MVNVFDRINKINKIKNHVNPVYFNFSFIFNLLMIN